MKGKYFLIGALSWLCMGAWAQSDFVKGADISSLTEQESRGVKFYDKNGQERECMSLLKDYQLNAVRLRVWVNPRGGWCGKDDVLKKALRAKALGMDVMLCFHYGDWWADPAGALIQTDEKRLGPAYPGGDITVEKQWCHTPLGAGGKRDEQRDALECEARTQWLGTERRERQHDHYRGHGSYLDTSEGICRLYPSWL